MRLTGKVKGVLNGVALEDADLFSYIMPGDGRSYTAIAKIPVRVGYELQTVITLGTSIAWLFSVSSKGAPNGFTITGEIFPPFGSTSRSACIIFSSSQVLSQVSLSVIYFMTNDYYMKGCIQ